MADKAEKRFGVTISLHVVEVDSGADFFNTNVQYPNMGYDGVVAVEQILLEGLQKLGQLGIAKAVADGHGDKLAKMGLLADRAAAVKPA